MFHVRQLFLARLHIGAFVRVRSSGHQECPLDEIGTFGAQYRAHADRLYAHMELAANRGLDALSEEQFHIVHSAEKIYQFTAGSLRALCFLAESGRVVICTHAFVKKRNKTPPAEVDKAIALKKRYLNEEVMWIEAESD